MATVFFEPSTRTRCSFEAAALRLGGKLLSCGDMQVLPEKRTLPLRIVQLRHVMGTRLALGLYHLSDIPNATLRSRVYVVFGLDQYTSKEAAGILPLSNA